MADVWRPTDWEQVQRYNDLQLLAAIKDGRCRPIPDVDNDGCIVWVYDFKEGDEFFHEVTSEPYTDEVVDLWRCRQITLDHNNKPSITGDGEDYLAELLAEATAAETELPRSLGHRV